MVTMSSSANSSTVHFLLYFCAIFSFALAVLVRISWIIESVSLDICSVWFSRVKDSALLMDTGLLTAGELLAVAGLLTVGLLSGSGLISSVTTPIVDSASESPFSFGRRA